MHFVDLLFHPHSVGDSPGGAIRFFSRRLVGLILGLSVLFCVPLFHGLVLAVTTELNSHILLIPIIARFFILSKRSMLPVAVSGWSSYVTAAIAFGFVSSAAYLGSRLRGWPSSPDDAVTFGVLGWIGFVWAACAWSWGEAFVRRLVFPLGLLVFMAPLPGWLVNQVEIFLQHASAEVAAWFFSASDIPFLRAGLVFDLPGITLRVAQECSGFRSTLVLFILSLLAGHLFLRRTGNRILLIALMIWVGIVRNGFRIFALAWLCVRVNPAMIDSPIHHRGGPIFFALSMIPSALILWALVRWERSWTRKTTGADVPGAIATDGKL